MRVEPRLRVLSAIVLWPMAVRAVLVDASKMTWGTSLALLSALFLFAVARSQIAFLGKSSVFWWNVACRADVAIFASKLAPETHFLPLIIFLTALRLTRATPEAEKHCCGGLVWKGAPLALLLCPGNQGYALDILCVAVVMASRARESYDVHCAGDYHKEAELRLVGDAVACYGIACAGSPFATRIVVFLAEMVLLGLAYATPRNTKLDHWDEKYSRTPAHAPLPFREV